MVVMEKVLIVGGSSTIALAAAQNWLAGGAEVTLVGRSGEKLQKAKNDLSIRYPNSKIDYQLFDPRNSSSILQVVSELDFNRVLIAIGELQESEEIGGNPSAITQLVNSNINLPMIFLAAIEAKFAKTGNGKVGVIGSVAGDRGRGKNYLYGASKAFLERAVEGLNQQYAKSGISFSIIKPGPTKSNMTLDLQAKGVKLADPIKVGRDIVKGIESGKAVIYTPKLWKIIMLVIKFLPKSIFNRLSF
jgi:short-subunit dehydrogenase